MKPWSELYTNMLVGALLESVHLGRSLSPLSAEETGTIYLSAKVVKCLGVVLKISLKYKRDKILWACLFCCKWLQVVSRKMRIGKVKCSKKNILCFTAFGW